MGGIESGFQFLGFKVDDVDLKLTPSIPIILYNKPILPEQVVMQLRIRNLFRITEDRMYVGGLDTRIEIYRSAKRGEDNRFLVAHVGVAGVFRTIDETIDSKTEEKLTRIQIPAILFPYLRVALTNLLTSAGFAGIILPLINVQEFAKNVKIKIIDQSKEKLSATVNH